jgi:PHP family Zn ribbon phosphoesterase
MKCFKADFHIHTCLSPCADITMTPGTIAEALSQKGLDWVAITDHNSTRNVRVFRNVLYEHGIIMIPGIEVHTREDVHILAYFPDVDTAEYFGSIVEAHLPEFETDPERDGYSLVVDEHDQFIGQIPKPFGFPTTLDIDSVVSLIRNNKGIAVFAHVFRAMGIFYQLGLLPEKQKEIPLEIYHLEKKKFLSGYIDTQHPVSLLSSSDAHTPDSIQEAKMEICCDTRSFDEFRKALLQEEGRSVRLCL